MVWPAYRLPLIVRLEIRPDGTGELAAKAEKSMWQPGTLSVNRTAEVSKPEVDKFLMLVEQANFWSIPTDEFFVENQRRAAETAATGRRRALVREMGGVDWDLEGATGAGYHLVSRKFPDPGGGKNWEKGPYAKLTLYLFRDLAKLEVPPIETTPTKR